MDWDKRVLTADHPSRGEMSVPFGTVDAQWMAACQGSEMRYPFDGDGEASSEIEQMREG